MKTTYHIVICFLVSLCCFSCKEDTTYKISEEKTQLGFEKLTSDITKIDFENIIKETESFNFLYYQYLYNGGGVAVGDINNDGLQDIYLVGNTTQDRLYINKGNFVFEDITVQSGIAGQSGFKTGVNMIDLNKDGFLDIYVCRSVVQEVEKRKNLLYINNGDNTFTEKASAYGLDDAGYSVQAYFLDADKDNTYEVYVLNHPKDMNNANNIKVKQNKDGSYSPEQVKDYSYISDRYYVMKNGKYEDFSASAGILDDAYGLSAVIADFNQDNLPDIYVANDYIKPDRLWINQGKHRFKDELDKYFKHTSFSSMGSDYADLNNDGKEDLMVLDMLSSTSARRHQLNHLTNVKKFKDMQRFGLGAQLSRNVLQINQNPAPFSDIAFMDNIAQTDWSWSVLMADFDNDGLKDIHITNGYYRNITNLDYMDFEINNLQDQYRKGQITLLDWLEKIPSEATQNFFFKNKGQLQFSNYSKPWQAQTDFSNGAAYADFNSDGRLDLVVNNLNAKAHILKNVMAKEQNYLNIQLKDDKNSILLGTKVNAYTTNNEILTETYNPQRGYLSSSQHLLHFGLGKAKIDSLEIHWPDGSYQVLKNPKINQTLEVKKAKSHDAITRPLKANTLLKKRKTTFKKHQENPYSEFDYERLIDRSYSDFGPTAVVFDFDKDAKEDLLLAGGKNQATQLYRQTSKGDFEVVKVPDFENDKSFEDTAIAIIDANRDGFADVVMGSGSNEHKLSSEHYALRLYVYNPKKQTFERHDFPKIAISTSKILVGDFDKDGLDDIFVASRIQPKNYPSIPQSMVFKQTENGFVNQTEQWLKDTRLGMLTDAVYEDLNHDGQLELMLVGEWMSPRVFRFDNGFQEITQNFGFADMKGLWESICITDVNQDGLKDILLGNRGLNNIYKANSNQPLKMLVGDFDQNSTTDYLMFQPDDKGEYKPLLGYKRVASQLPKIRKSYNSYQDYALASWEDYLKKKDYKKLGINELNHVLLLNLGENKFIRKHLPHFTQNSVGRTFSSININGETYILLAGNHYDTDAEFTVYDASSGQVLKWNPKEEQLEILPVEKTGFIASGDVREVRIIKVNGKTCILILNNNEKPEMFVVK